jgi:hypothetical protein
MLQHEGRAFLKSCLITFYLAYFFVFIAKSAKNAKKKVETLYILRASWFFVRDSTEIADFKKVLTCPGGRCQGSRFR